MINVIYIYKNSFWHDYTFTIFSGKTHILGQLKNLRDIQEDQLHKEPTEVWDFAAGSVPSIMSTYATHDKSAKHAVNFQYVVLSMLLKQNYNISQSKSQRHVTERSLCSCKNMFIENLKVSPADRERLMDYANEIELRSYRPKGVIILDVEPQIALERLKRRKDIVNIEYSEGDMIRMREDLHKTGKIYRDMGIPTYTVDSQEVALHLCTRFLQEGIRPETRASSPDEGYSEAMDGLVPSDPESNV